MSDQEQDQNREPELNIPDADPIESKPIPVAPAKASGAMRLLVTFLLLAVLALAAALAGVVHLALQEKQSLLDQQQLVKDKADGLKQRFVELQDENFKQLQQSLKTVDQKLAANDKKTDSKIAGVMEQVNAISTTTETDWRLAEVEYLTRLATHRLHLARDIQGAGKLLATSAAILADLSDPGLIPARQVIAEDMAKIRAASKYDDTAIYLKLKALAPQVATLPLYRQPNVDFGDSGSNNDDTLQGWDRLSASFNRVATQYFQVRRNTNIQPLLSSEDESSLRQLISLKLEQAASALLQNKADIYRSNLQQVRQHVADNFLVDEQAVIAFLAEVDELSVLEVNPELPDISHSHRIVSQFIEGRHRIDVPKRVSAKPVAPVKPQAAASGPQANKQPPVKPQAPVQAVKPVDDKATTEQAQ